MSIERNRFGKHTITCDDPHKRGCCAQFGSFFGEPRTTRKARENRWFYSESTGKYACPLCVGFHKDLVKKFGGRLRQKVPRGIARAGGFYDSDDFFDPFG